MTSSMYEIREMREEDITRILQIEQASFAAPWTEDSFRVQLGLEDIAINLVMVEDRIVVGYIVAWIAYDEIHILSLAVMPDKRRRGYGKNLLDEAIEIGKKRGGCRVILEVRVSNVSAQNIYSNYGFEIIGRRKRYYRGTGEDALVMELKLGP